MKKSLVIALVVSFVLSVAGTALAFPVEFNGDFRLQGRSIDDKITGATADTSFWQLRARLGFEGKIDENTAFFGRLSTRNSFGGNQTSSSTGVGEFDQYGVKLTSENWKFSVGRQAVNVGQGTILSTGYDAAGVDNKFDGLVASTKLGDYSVTVIGGKTTTTSVRVANTASEWYGVDIAAKADDKFSYGASYVHSKENTTGIEGLNNWAVNATFAISPKVSLNGEYTRSNADTFNKAYFMAGTYSWDKSSFTVQYQKVDANAVDQYNSGIGAVAYPMGAGITGAGINGYKGFTYAYNQQMTKAASFHIVYLDLKAVGTATGSNKELAGGVAWKF